VNLFAHLRGCRDTHGPERLAPQRANAVIARSTTSPTTCTRSSRRAASRWTCAPPSSSCMSAPSSAMSATLPSRLLGIGAQGRLEAIDVVPLTLEDAAQRERICALMPHDDAFHARRRATRTTGGAADRA
jgi:hypothetical protein